MDQDLTSHSAARLAREIAERTVSAREVVKAMLARVEAVNPTLNAICTLNEEALAEADAVDRRLAGGAAATAARRGAARRQGQHLHSRDPHDVRLEDPRGGRPGRRLHLRRAPAVRRREFVLGKTNTPEFAHDVNTTKPHLRDHPQSLERQPHRGGLERGHRLCRRGSGWHPAGLGTDLGGSIRVPSLLQRPRRDPPGSGAGGVPSDRVRLDNPGRARARVRWPGR